jgi:hypothetical protein
MKDLIHRGPYRNLNNGEIYFVIDVVINETNGRQNGEVMVLYI